ncbi:MAG: NAD-dependent epimerase/dehydratase family protein [Beijerinckiaceae bacterium]
MSGHYTVFGGNGFVGGEVARLLESRGHSVNRITRTNWPETGTNLGNVIFTIGMTADFRKRLVETVEMQVMRLHESLTRYSFTSFTYLSSARVYDGAASTREDAALLVRPSEQDHVYNISKLAGESLCFAYGNPKIRVVRMSNVYGVTDVSNLFLTAVMREAVETGAVTIGQSPLSSKDYICVEDVAEALVRIAAEGQHQLYNVAAGQNVTHQMIADILEQAGYKVSFKPGGSTVTIPPIDVSRLNTEFNLIQTDPRDAIARVLRTIQENRKTQ